MRFVGIDLGAMALHCVVLDEARRVVDGRVLSPDASSELESVAAGATGVAIDAPAALSTAPHTDDLALAPKFRLARCCEVALGREHRLWVPWVTPTVAGSLPGWMQVGLRLYAELAANGHAPIEVYPYAGFRLLAGGALPKKTTVEGVRKRVALLAAQGVAGRWMRLWSHDALDATLAALLALRASEGTAIPVGCGHDASAIWIPTAS